MPSKIIKMYTSAIRKQADQAADTKEPTQSQIRDYNQMQEIIDHEVPKQSFGARIGRKIGQPFYPHIMDLIRRDQKLPNADEQQEAFMVPLEDPRHYGIQKMPYNTLAASDRYKPWFWEAIKNIPVYNQGQAENYYGRLGIPKQKWPMAEQIAYLNRLTAARSESTIPLMNAIQTRIAQARKDGTQAADVERDIHTALRESDAYNNLNKDINAKLNLKYNKQNKMFDPLRKALAEGKAAQQKIRMNAYVQDGLKKQQERLSQEYARIDKILTDGINTKTGKPLSPDEIRAYNGLIQEINEKTKNVRARLEEYEQNTAPVLTPEQQDALDMYEWIQNNQFISRNNNPGYSGTGGNIPT